MQSSAVCSEAQSVPFKGFAWKQWYKGSPRRKHLKQGCNPNVSLAWFIFAGCLLTVPPFCSCRRASTHILTWEPLGCQPASLPFLEENREYLIFLSYLQPKGFVFKLDLYLMDCLNFWWAFPFLSVLQSLFFSRKCRWSDAARALPSRCTDRARHPTARSPDQHTQPRGSGVRRHHQQSHTSRLHRRQGLCQDLGHQPARQQEPSVPTRLPGNFVILLEVSGGESVKCDLDACH